MLAREVLVERYKDKNLKRRPVSTSEHRVFQHIINSHRRKLCERMQLPESVKRIMRKFADESCWEKSRL